MQMSHMFGKNGESLLQTKKKDGWTAAKDRFEELNPCHLFLDYNEHFRNALHSKTVVN